MCAFFCEQSEKHDFSDAHRGSDQMVNATNNPQDATEDVAVNSQNKPNLAANSFHINNPHYQGKMHYAQPNIAQNFFQYPNRTPYWNPAYGYSNAQNMMYAPSKANTTNDSAIIEGSTDILESSTTVENENICLPDIGNPNATVSNSSQFMHDIHPIVIPPDNQRQAMIGETVLPVIPNSLPFPHTPLGCTISTPILPPTPVCSNCNNFMVPSWRCPSGHSELGAIPMANPSAYLPTQPSPTIESTLPNPMLYPNVPIPPLMHSHVAAPNTMMPNQSRTMVPQPMWDQSQIYNTLPQNVNQDQSAINISQDSAEPPVSTQLVSSQISVPVTSQVPSNIQIQAQNTIISQPSEPHIVQEDKIVHNSQEGSKQTRDLPQIQRPVGQGLWNAMHAVKPRRSNGLDPGYDHFARSRMRINASEPMFVGPDCSVN